MKIFLMLLASGLVLSGCVSQKPVVNEPVNNVVVPTPIVQTETPSQIDQGGAEFDGPEGADGEIIE